MLQLKCMYCGTEMPDDANFCMKCGALLPTRDNPIVQERIKKAHGWIRHGESTNNPWEAADMLYDHAWEECLEPLFHPADFFLSNSP
jgi:ribosomal protein L40E